MAARRPPVTGAFFLVALIVAVLAAGWAMDYLDVQLRGWWVPVGLTGALVLFSLALAVYGRWIGGRIGMWSVSTFIATQWRGGCHRSKRYVQQIGSRRRIVFVKYVPVSYTHLRAHET